MFVDVARNLARWDFRTALRFERAYIAVELTGAIQSRLALMHGATGPKPPSTRAVVDVIGRVIWKVAAREGAVIPRRLSEHWDVWRDAFLLIQPVQRRSCPVSGISDKPLGLKAEALLRSLDHGYCRADLQVEPVGDVQSASRGPPCEKPKGGLMSRHPVCPRSADRRPARWNRFLDRRPCWRSARRGRRHRCRDCACIAGSVPRRREAPLPR